MSDIPEARARLEAIAEDLESLGLVVQAMAVRDTIPLLYRRPYARDKAPARSAWVDASTAAEIRHMARRNPHLSQQKIAEAFGVNAGRVSEALQGDR